MVVNISLHFCGYVSSDPELDKELLVNLGTVEKSVGASTTCGAFCE